MKHTYAPRLAALLLACLTLFCACRTKSSELHLENGAFRNEQTGVAYREAPATYRATSVLQGEPLFRAMGVLSDGIPLYAIEGADADDYLTDEHYTLYYNENVTLPTLAEMKPYAISLSYNAIERGKLDEGDQEAIDLLMQRLEQDVTYPKSALPAAAHERFELLFHSKEYPGFFYALEYWKYENSFTFTHDGKEISVEKGVVYDRGRDCFYAMGDVLEDTFTKYA